MVLEVLEVLLEVLEVVLMFLCSFGRPQCTGQSSSMICSLGDTELSTFRDFPDVEGFRVSSRKYRNS